MEKFESSDETSHLILRIQAGTDADECDSLTRELRSELLELGVGSVDFVSGKDLLPGAKAADPVTIGALMLAVVPVFLPKLLEYLQSWTMRAESRRIRVKTQVGDRSIELEFSPAAISKDELEKFVKKITGALIEKPRKLDPNTN